MVDRLNVDLRALVSKSKLLTLWTLLWPVVNSAENDLASTIPSRFMYTTLQSRALCRYHNQPSARLYETKIKDGPCPMAFLGERGLWKCFSRTAGVFWVVSVVQKVIILRGGWICFCGQPGSTAFLYAIDHRTIRNNEIKPKCQRKTDVS